MTRRAVYAAAALGGALAVLLVAWFLSGWADVRAQQRAARAAPVEAAARRGAALAHELRGELARLFARETERPYFHYRNLFHDPRAAWNAVGVATSPLASAPEDPLVLGYFQLDAAGRLTTPTINDEAPELSDARHAAGNRWFLDEAVRGFAGQLRAPAEVADAAQPAQVGQVGQVAQVEKAAPRPPVRVAKAPPPPKGKTATKVVQLDNTSYVQNAAPERFYRYQNDVGRNVASTIAADEERRRVALARVPELAATERAPGQVTITISALEWRTLPFAGAPALVAVRQVETPDGPLAQGFVIDRTTLTTWLAARAGDTVAELRAAPVDSGDGDGGDGDDGGEARAAGAEIAPGWALAVTANPRVLAEAAAGAARIARDFVLRFALVGVIAVLAAAFVVVMVARAERLARERSQFAAAAAHELRTPLAGLQLYGDMLADGLGDPAKLRDYARRMSEEASRLGRVVSNVLGFSQLERGNLSIDARPAHLADALRELAERSVPALDRAGAALELDVPAELDARFDRDALARIVGNLLDNAEKYGRDADDRTITLAARDAGDAVEVVVTDRGPGLTAAARARLFRPFARGVSTDGPAGLGLGLALSRSLAHAMGGSLDYRAPDGGGAAFVLRLAKV